VIKTDTSCTRKPLTAKTVQTGDEQRFECVFVKEDGKAKLRVVTTDIQDDSNIQVTTGLSEGEEVITGPYNTVTKTLRCDDEVTVATSDKDTSEED
jgi:HlyD family secretion protein